MENFPEGKFLTTVKIGPKGQIVIPKEVRDMFSLNTGDSLLLFKKAFNGGQRTRYRLAAVFLYGNAVECG